MKFKYIKRTLEKPLVRASKEFPAVVLTGPRQSGKTTLLKHLFGKNCKYVSLEPPDVRAASSADPRGFLNMHEPPVIFDEVQYAPELLPYIKERIDSHRQKTGQYFLTGSQNLLLMERVTESLAGRAAMLKLLPFSQRELRGDPSTVLPWEKKKYQLDSNESSYKDLWKGFLRGSYPEIATDLKRDINLWHSSYIQTYLERDVRMLRQVGDLTLFQNFLSALAMRSGQLLSLTDIARDLGVAVNTIKSWLSVLEATFQVMILRPYFSNIGKRLVKSPKVYFTDVGTLCYLVGLKDPDHAASGPMGGVILETAVLSEIRKTLLHRGEEPQMYFWRTSSGREVDLIVQWEAKLVPIEIKLSSTPKPSMADGIRVFQDDFKDQATPGYVVHPGDICLPLAPKISAIPFNF
jgi:uncharacterized protein